MHEGITVHKHQQVLVTVTTTAHCFVQTFDERYCKGSSTATLSCAVYQQNVTVFSYDDVGVGAAIFMDVIHSLLHAVHHLYTALQISILSPQRPHLGGAEGQVRCKLGTGVDFDL